MRTTRLEKLPATIYSLWIQGEPHAPAVVKLNWDRWRFLNPGHRLVILDERSALDHIGDLAIDPTTLSPQAFSDVLRVNLLARYGGIWVDASVFPLTPVRQWLGPCLTDSSFFAYSAPGPDRLLSSWFLAARKGSPTMKAWLEATIGYWSKDRVLMRGEAVGIHIPDDPVYSVAPTGGGRGDSYPYFWLHYLFGYLHQTDPQVAAEWSSRVDKAAGPAHRLQTLLRNNAEAPLEAISAAATSAEMQKLDWKLDYPLELLSTLDTGRSTPWPQRVVAKLSRLPTLGRPAPTTTEGPNP